MARPYEGKLAIVTGASRGSSAFFSYTACRETRITSIN